MAKQSKRRKPSESATAIHIHEEAAAAVDSRAEAPAVNKSEEIRRLAREMQARGETPRPVTIVKALGARGITVSSPQVSIVLKREGVERRPRKSRAPAAAAAAPAANGFSSADAFTVHQLLAAKKFVEMVGSQRQALALLDALGKIT